jgi:hypothetical protein
VTSERHLGYLLRAGTSETSREGEPPCEPRADAGSDGAEPFPEASIAIASR